MWAARYGPTPEDRGRRIQRGLPVKAANGLPAPLPGLLNRVHIEGGIQYKGHLETNHSTTQRFVLSQRFTETHPAWQERRAYRVQYHGLEPLHCSCPDHVLRERKCKHMYAVEFELTSRRGALPLARTITTRQDRR